MLEPQIYCSIENSRLNAFHRKIENDLAENRNLKELPPLSMKFKGILGLIKLDLLAAEDRLIKMIA